MLLAVVVVPEARPEVALLSVNVWVFGDHPLSRLLHLGGDPEEGTQTGC